MKRLLVYNQSPGFILPYEEIGRMNLQIEEIIEIKEALRTHFFHQKGSSDFDDADIFLVSIEQPVKEVVDFLRYVKKYKPAIPLIVLSPSVRKSYLIESQLKVVDTYFTERVHLTDILYLLSCPSTG